MSASVAKKRRTLGKKRGICPLLSVPDWVNKALENGRPPELFLGCRSEKENVSRALQPPTLRPNAPLLGLILGTHVLMGRPTDVYLSLGRVLWEAQSPPP